MNSEELEFAQHNLGIQKHYDFTQYAHDNHVNVIPEEDFKHLVEETFRTIADILRKTYGPYASTVIISEQSETTSTKDGYNVFNAIGFAHKYKRLVYLAIAKIINRVNATVGDGTTSCILLAEKMFKEIEAVLKTVDDKRNILSVMDEMQALLQSHKFVADDYKNNVVRPLTITALEGLISMAGNYDPQITNVIMDALDPVVDEETGRVMSVRHVVPEMKPDIDQRGVTSYEVRQLPGNYRVNVSFLEQEVALKFQEPTKMHVLVYDHAFGSSDWNFFMDQYDKETPVLILARSINQKFLDTDFAQYFRKLVLVNKGDWTNCPIMFAEIRTGDGGSVRDEINDLCALLQTKPINLANKAIDHSAIPYVSIQVTNGNCLSFDVDYVPEAYIQTLVMEMEADLTNSMVKHEIYKFRIRALRHELNQSSITVRSSSSLESKMISDKIDDCLSIVDSAMEYGVVPNILAYGYHRIEPFTKSDNDLQKCVAIAIQNSIRGLFNDIWESKHGNQFLDKRDVIVNEMYSQTDQSFDIVKETFCDVDQLPTSSRYDLEVIAASISIVKYLLTSRALIFDANMLRPLDDTGSYVSR